MHLSLIYGGTSFVAVRLVRLTDIGPPPPPPHAAPLKAVQLATEEKDGGTDGAHPPLALDYPCDYELLSLLEPHKKFQVSRAEQRKRCSCSCCCSCSWLRERLCYGASGGLM